MLRAVSGWHGNIGRRLLSWWLGELRAMLPPQMRAALGPGGQRLLLEFEDDSLVATLLSQDERHTLDRYAWRDGLQDTVRRRLIRLPAERVLCLPPARVLRRRVELPLATEENLRQVLGFELDRHTPLKAEEACYDYLPLERDTARRILTVELAVVPSILMQETTAQLQHLGLPVHRASVLGDDGAVLDLNLLPEQQRARVTRIPLFVNATLACAAAVLLIMILALPLYAKHARLEALEPLVTQARSDAVTARDLRETLQTLSAEAGFVLEKRRAEIPALDIINEVTQVLPDHTWVRQLTLQNGEIQLSGESVSAALLVQLLESSTLLRNVRFRSPVLEDARSGVERFHLSAEYGPLDGSS
ncbi:MAG: PilN domain-containing protein [Gammaproteobacteria bacterium]|nr:PilN domain-containing protein [Gammaproteobacteria bacterium]